MTIDIVYIWLRTLTFLVLAPVGKRLSPNLPFPCSTSSQLLSFFKLLLFFLGLSKAIKISRQLPSLAQTSVRPLLYLVPNERGAAPILCILSIKPFKSWYLHFSYLNKIEILKECHPCHAAWGLWSQLRSNIILFEIVFDWWYALSVAL